MLERYRKTMNEDILHSWADDAQKKLDNLQEIVQEMRNSYEATYNMSIAGRKYLKKMDKALQM